ncbi:prepilin-type N-terminal cleavage/methylation domain-containing protein [Candidatus Sumerlaeota bacterium]|nr:prepilin-type N-terminal cleavage/methylation domain-containing protein [Candidatus Sumerlaeota bacterium]
MMNRSEGRSGFTLIELLIVVLIIAILAAIAVPNFLEFQVRAKVSRSMADMRSLAIALEAYCVDEGDYPYSYWDTSYRERLICLTNPLAYISTIPFDVFAETVIKNNAAWIASGGDDSNDGGFDYWTKWAAWGYAEPVVGDTPWNFPTNADSPFKYQLRSLGPDQKYDGGNTFGPSMPPSPYDNLPMAYDPTNGTVSAGDVYMWGPGTCWNFDCF